MTKPSDFKVLSDAEHMLMRPGMYIGSTIAEPISGVFGAKYSTVNVVPGLLKVINEIIDNSVDEFIRTGGKYATKIDVTVDQSPVDSLCVSVTDNGRGLPQGMAGDVPIAVAAWTKARSGSNFTDDRTTIGMNGVGSFATAVFSSKFIGATHIEDGTGITVCSMNNCDEVTHRKSKGKQGTSVKFWPELGRFGVTELSEDHLLVLKDRLVNLSICFPDIQFSFNGEKIKFKNLKTIAEKFSEHAHTLDHHATEPDRSIKLVVMSNSDLAADDDTSETFITHSYVNGLNTRLGGAHIEFVCNKIVADLRVQIKKKFKFEVSPAHIRAHLFLAIWMTGVNNLKFDSQTKERVTNTQSEIGLCFDGVDFERFIKKLMTDDRIIMPIVEAQIRKAEAAQLAELRKKNKDSDRANLRKITKFTDATDKKNRRDCMLFITEGDAANSAILSARTPQIGCFPLRGKPINALGASIKEVLENKEISDLFTIMGLKIGERVRSLEDLRFGKIVICADADADGAHITGLLIATFYKFWPELFELGAIYQFRTPIAKTVSGKKEEFFYDIEIFRAYSKKNPSIKTRYLKGLGSSVATDFKMYFEDMTKNLGHVKIDTTADLAVVELVFGKETDSANQRKVWLDLE